MVRSTKTSGIPACWTVWRVTWAVEKGATMMPSTRWRRSTSMYSRISSGSSLALHSTTDRPEARASRSTTWASSAKKGLRTSGISRPIGLGAFGAQGAGLGIGDVVQALGGGEHPFAGLGGDGAVPGQRARGGAERHSGLGGDVLDRRSRHLQLLTSSLMETFPSGSVALDEGWGAGADGPASRPRGRGGVRRGSDAGAGGLRFLPGEDAHCASTVMWVTYLRGRRDHRPRGRSAALG